MNPLARLFAKTPSAMDIRLQLKKLERDHWKKRRELEGIQQAKAAKVEAAVTAKKAGRQEVVQDIFREMRQIEIDYGYVSSDLRRLSLSKTALAAFLRKLEMLESDKDHKSVQNLVRRYHDSSIQKTIDQAEVDDDTFGAMLQEVLGETESAVAHEKAQEDAGFAEFDRAIEEMAAAKVADDREQPAPGAMPDVKVKMRSSHTIYAPDERAELENKVQELKREKSELERKLAGQDNKLAMARARAASLREWAEINRLHCGDEDKETARQRVLALERLADQADQEVEEVEKRTNIDARQSEEAITDPYVKERDRTKIPERYQWNLADIYPSREAWKSAKTKLASEFPEITKFRGRLAESAQSLCCCLETFSRFKKELTRLMCYARMTSDLDIRDSAALAMKQEMGQIETDFAALASYVRPEILAIGRHKIEAFVAEDSSLETFRHSLDDILRREEHTGTEGEEKIIADAGLISDAPMSIYSVFSNADFPFPEVTLSTGVTVRLDPPAYSLQLRSPVREDRKKVFAAYLGKKHEFRRTFGAQLYAGVKNSMFFSRARRYGSSLEQALDANNIPVSVYTNLVDGVRQNLGTLHRYLGIRKKLQGLEELHYYDLSAPLVKQIDRNYRFEEASALVLSALEPLGQDYTAVVREAFQNRWIDVYHNEGKRSGAYSDGMVYDVHPYILLNYTGKYGDVSTLAHELGHTMHSHLSNLAQPYHLSRYCIFIAEVASTFNEALLLDYMLKTVTDDSERLSLLVTYLDGAHGTFFRQAQLAEYEMRIHETAEKGEALTGDLLSSMYGQIVKDHHGHDAGVCVVDDEIRAGWSGIHHFYYNFYVYQYATSFTASSALAERVLSGDGAARTAYLDLLRSGDTDYPVNLLRKAGVDMTTQEPLRATLRKMNRVMDEVEEIASRLF